MADERTRELERAAAAGDPEAEKSLRRARCKAGEHCGHKTEWRHFPLEKMQKLWTEMGSFLLAASPDGGRAQVSAVVDYRHSFLAVAELNIDWALCRVVHSTDNDTGRETLFIDRQIPGWINPIQSGLAMTQMKVDEHTGEQEA